MNNPRRDGVIELFRFIAILLACIMVGLKGFNVAFLIESKFIKIVAQSSFSIYLYNYILYVFPTVGNVWLIVPAVIGVFLFGSIMYLIVEKPFEKLRYRIVSLIKERFVSC